MKNIFPVLIVIFILMQFFQINKDNPPVNKGVDLLTIKKTPAETATLIRNACYDCHSNETKYPWYSYIQPGGWFLKSHIDDGRRKLNFSTFANLDPKRQAHKLYESWEMIELKKMPLDSYAMVHTDAVLTNEERDHLIKYFKKLENDTRIYYQLPNEK